MSVYERVWMHFQTILYTWRDDYISGAFSLVQQIVIIFFLITAAVAFVVKI